MQEPDVSGVRAPDLETALGPKPGGVITLCAACTRLGSCRLGLTREDLQDDGTVSTALSCPRDHEGGPGVAHGGWTAGALDEMVGHVPLLHRQLSVTAQLTVHFRKPVPIERALVGRARPVRRADGKWWVEATIELAATGSVLATAEAVLVERDPSHFRRHQEWLAEQDGAVPSGRQGS